MIRVRKPEGSGWTAIPNATLRDERLSFRARGALAWMLSHDDGYLVGTEQLHAHANEGREAIRTVLRELRDAGYVRQAREQDEKGRWRTVTEVSATSSTGAQEPATGDGFPGAGYPGAGSLGAIEKTRGEDQENDDDFVVVDARESTSRAPLAAAVAACGPQGANVAAKAAEIETVVGRMAGWQAAILHNALMDSEAGVVALADEARHARRPAAWLAENLRHRAHLDAKRRIPARSDADERRADRLERSRAVAERLNAVRKVAS